MEDYKLRDLRASHTPSFDHLERKEKEKKSFSQACLFVSRLPWFNPKLSAYGLRPIAHNFGPHRDFTRSLLSFLLLKNLPPPPPFPA